MLDAERELKAELGAGEVFGEISLLLTGKRQATVRALSYCALYMLEKRDFFKALMDRPQFAERIMQAALEHYNIIMNPSEWSSSDVDGEEKPRW